MVLVTTVGRCIAKRTKVTAQSTKNLWPTQDYQYPIWLMLYLFYSSDMFEILRCPFPKWSFPTDATPKSHQCSVSHSINPITSFSLPLSLHLLPNPFAPVAIWYKYFDILSTASLNKFDCTNTVFHIRLAHNTTLKKFYYLVPQANFRSSILIKFSNELEEIKMKLVPSHFSKTTLSQAQLFVIRQCNYQRNNYRYFKNCLLYIVFYFN